MTARPLYIHNALLIDAAAEQPSAGSLLALEGRIVALNPDPDAIPEGTQSIDAGGKWLAPGIIDIGVFATDKPAFHFGGITRAALIPSEAHLLDDPGRVEHAAKKGKPDLWVHPLAAATKGLKGRELSELALMREAGARAVSTGRVRIADSAIMYRLLAYAASLDMAVVSHAEDESLIASAVATDGEIATRMGLSSAPAIAEAMAVARDLMLVEETGARIHFRQLTTARALDLVRAAKAKSLAVTCSITLAHVLLSDIATAEFRTFAKFSPPLRCEADRLACLEAIRDGTIDMLSSGHDPRGPEDKRLPFAEAAPGMAGAETLLALALILVHDGQMTPGHLFNMLSAAPARLLKVKAGQLKIGYECDIILINPSAPWRINTHRMAACAGNTPFDGLAVQGRAVSVWKSGKHIR